MAFVKIYVHLLYILSYFKFLYTYFQKNIFSLYPAFSSLHREIISIGKIEKFDQDKIGHRNLIFYIIFHRHLYRIDIQIFAAERCQRIVLQSGDGDCLYMVRPQSTPQFHDRQGFPREGDRMTRSSSPAVFCSARHISCRWICTISFTGRKILFISLAALV